jgi:hypothetical protein
MQPAPRPGVERWRIEQDLKSARASPAIDHADVGVDPSSVRSLPVALKDKVIALSPDPQGLCRVCHQGRLLGLPFAVLVSGAHPGRDEVPLSVSCVVGVQDCRSSGWRAALI